MSIDEAQLKTMMSQLDEDGNGNVTKDEFRTPYKKLFPKTTDKEFDALWAKIDQDSSGTLELKELAKYYGYDLDKLKDDQEMSDEQILEALQMQAALAELQAQAEAKRESSPSQQKADPTGAKKLSSGMNRRGSSSTVEARKKNSSGVVTVKMPSKTTFEVCDPHVLFLQACELGDEKDIKDRIAAGANVRIEDDKGEMPLHKLCRIGSLDMVRLVLDKSSELKTDINWQDKQGKTATFFAAENKKSDIVSMLLDRGADCMIENNNGWTVLHTAINADDETCTKTILLHQFVTPLKKKLIDVADKQGRTALHIAGFKAEVNLVELLLQHGADATSLDVGGNSAGSLAKKSGRRKSKDLLDAASGAAS